MLFLHYVYWEHVLGRTEGITLGKLKGMFNEDNVNFAHENIIYKLNIEPNIRGVLS